MHPLLRSEINPERPEAFEKDEAGRRHQPVIKPGLTNEEDRQIEPSEYARVEKEECQDRATRPGS